MNYEQLAKIKAFISLYSSKETTNILDGDFRSVFRGRSLDFDDLREYTYGDNVKDIDWKSSTKTGKTLVRRYVAEKKHNVLFVMDSGIKMEADTSGGDDKSQVAIDALGVMAYLVNQGGDDYALLQDSDEGIIFTTFGGGGKHFEGLMETSRKHMSEEGIRDVADLLEYAAESIRRRMVIVVITDMDGLSRIGDKLLGKLIVNNDVMVVDIDDAFLYGDRVYDVAGKKYESELLIGGKSLKEAEENQRNDLLQAVEERFKSNRVTMVKMTREEDILPKTIELFERHRNGINR